MSQRFIDAIEFATTAHDGQVRKLSTAPYILHPLEVASVIGGITDDEDILIAGLLHDVVEDAGVSLSEIEDKFGERVARLVTSETEDKRANRPPSETWKMRKEVSLQLLSGTDDMAIKILWLGDKLSNIRSFYRTWLDIGDEMFNAFHQKDKNEHKWYYNKIAEYLSDLKETAAYSEYIFLVNKIFE